MSETEQSDDVEKEHPQDIFREGDEIPWKDGLAVVTEREAVEALPEYVPGWQEPADHQPVEQDDDADYVLLHLDLPGTADEDEGVVPASWLATKLNASYDRHGFPTIMTSIRDGAGTSGKTTVSVPSVGSQSLDRHEARELAGHLREYSDFEPLRVLLGGADTEEGVLEVADALERAARVRDLAHRLE